jgi:hypothetical protein
MDEESSCYLGETACLFLIVLIDNKTGTVLVIQDRARFIGRLLRLCLQEQKIHYGKLVVTISKVFL